MLSKMLIVNDNSIIKNDNKLIIKFAEPKI